MKTIKLPYGTTYLLTDSETELDTEQYLIQQDEHGQFYAMDKISDSELHIPRTTAISSMTIEASRFSNGSTRFGQEIHTQTEQGQKNAYNRPLNLDKALYKEIRFIHIGKIIFTGTIDLVYPHYIADIKTGKSSSHYGYQMLGYAYALGYEVAKLFYYDTLMGSRSENFYYLSERYELWESRYQEWVEQYNKREAFKEKEVIQVWKEKKDKDETIQGLKEYAQYSMVSSYFAKKFEVFKEQTKDKFCIFLAGKKLEIIDELDNTKTSISVVNNSKSRTSYLKVNTQDQPTLQDIEQIMGFTAPIYDEVAL